MKTKRVSSAALVAIALSALGPVLLAGGSAAALTAPIAASSTLVATATAPDSRSVVLVDDPVVDPPAEPPVDPPVETAPPTSDPDPTATPDPTDTAAPTEPPAPPVTVDPIPPTDVPVIPDPVPTEVAPVPSETAAPPVVEEPVIPSDDSGSGVSDDETTETPVPTETPTPTPVPTVTATAAPAPVIELPFYPPPSAGTARDTFPFVVAGVAGALVLLGGIATYVFSRWRLRRLGFASTGRRSGNGPSGPLRGAGAVSVAPRTLRLGSIRGGATPLSLQLGLPASSASAHEAPTYELGFRPLASLEQSAETSRDSLQLGLAPASAASSGGPSIRSFLLGFTRRPKSASEADPAATFSVFGPRRVAPTPPSQFGLGLPTRAPRSDGAGGGSFDLGLPAV